MREKKRREKEEGRAMRGEILKIKYEGRVMRIKDN